MELEPKLTQQMDGFRMRKLRQCFDKALEKSLKNINKEVFLQCFDLAVIERNSELFSKLHQEFLQTLSVQLKVISLSFFKLNFLKKRMNLKTYVKEERW